jgi:hypothetical protein
LLPAVALTATSSEIAVAFVCVTSGSCTSASFVIAVALASSEIAVAFVASPAVLADQLHLL